MKPATLLLAASLTANAALLGAFALKPTLIPSPLQKYFGRGSATSMPSPNNTSVEPDDPARSGARGERSAAKPAGLWPALESTDLRTLVARLRAAGFPPTVIRAVLQAQLEQRTRGQIEAIAAQLTAVPYWKPEESSPFAPSKIFNEINAISRESFRTLRDLLGDDFFAAPGAHPDEVVRQRFGNIPRHKVELVQRIADDYNEMISQVRVEAQGIMLARDRETIALLEQERRNDLAAVLSPEELEEYEMRTSRVTSNLRRTLTYMDATEDEFRAIYRAVAPYAEQLYPTSGGIRLAEDRMSARQQAAEALKAVLPPERHADFLRADNNEFQQLARFAQNENLPPDVAVRAFALRDGVAAESARIADDQSMNADAKRAALKALADRTRAQATTLLGPKGGETYSRNVNWLSLLDRGMAITFNADGQARPRPVGAPSRAPTR